MSGRARAVTSLLWLVVACILGVTAAVAANHWFDPNDATPVQLQFVYSPDATGVVADQIAAFNKSGTTVDGHPIVVTADDVASGQAEQQLEDGSLQPNLWMPASSLWTDLLNKRSKTTGPLGGPSFVWSPQVVAIWEPLARRLGWPNPTVRWSDVLEVARTDPDYRFGHTNPDYSTSGLTAMIAEYANAAGHTAGGLVADDVSDPAITTAVREQERHIVHYGDTADAFLEQMASYRMRYASWVITQESSLVRFRLKYPALQPHLIALYPSDGTYIADYPLVVIPSSTPWVDDREAEAARMVRSWLISHLTAADAADEGFRTGSQSTRAVPPVDAPHGANPDPPASLPLPDPSVTAAIQQQWPLVRKPADVALVVDRACLQPDGGRVVQDGINTLLDGFSQRDRVSLWAAGPTAEEVRPPALLADSGPALSEAVDALEPATAAATFDAIAAAHASISSLGAADRNGGVVVMTDGRSDIGNTSLEDLVRSLRQPVGSERVRVFAVACSTSSEMQVLRRFTYAAQGEAFKWDLDDINKVYRSLSSYY